MENIHSPFFVVPEFLSPLLCEEIVDSLKLTVPEYDKDDNPLASFRHHDVSEEAIYERIVPLIPEIEKHYNIEYHSSERVRFEWFPDGCSGEKLHCENSNYVRKKWLRVRNRDLSVVIALCDFQSTIPFDGDFEVYGGKLEFPQHRFGLNPQRGTLIIFPSGPHFINCTTEILAGDLYRARFHIAAQKPFLYNPTDFPGNFTSWLREFA